MIPSRPYLIRAFYDWITDSEWTPYLLVNAEFEHVSVPQVFIEDGKIVLNISFKAVRSLEMTNTEVKFTARFNGMMEDIFVPVGAVEAIYARENGQGMHFSDYDMTPNSDEDVTSSDSGSGDSDSGKKGPPNLRIVK
jgi:stringent starvation protein B